MFLLKLLSYMLIGLGSMPLWEVLVNYSWGVEYHFVSEWTHVPQGSILIMGVFFLILGSALLFFAQKKIAESE